MASSRIRPSRAVADAVGIRAYLLSYSLRGLAFFGFLSTPESTFAQLASTSERSEEAEMETDRDSFTQATSTVGRCRTMLESAYTFIDNREAAELHSFPELLVRHGLTDRCELRFGTNYEVGGSGNPVSGNIPVSGLHHSELEHATTLSYGLKYQLSNQQEWRPKISSLATFFTPTSGPESKTRFASSLVGGWKLSNGWLFNNAIRYSTGAFEEDDFNVWAPSSVLKFPIGHRWNSHIEYFGVFSDGRSNETSQSFVSTGVNHLLNENLELGCRYGWGLNDQAPNFFYNVGFGTRF